MTQKFKEKAPTDSKVRLENDLLERKNKGISKAFDILNQLGLEGFKEERRDDYPQER